MLNPIQFKVEEELGGETYTLTINDFAEISGLTKEEVEYHIAKELEHTLRW